jgi:dihydroorotate dehydrogenase
VAVAEASGVVDGYVCGNTSSNREFPGYTMGTGQKELAAIGDGGLSGRPIRGAARELVRDVFRYTGGRKPVIGCGGVFTADDAWDMIVSGASAVQLLTGMIYEGPGIAHHIKRGLVRKLDEHGIETIRDAVGIDA